MEAVSDLGCRFVKGVKLLVADGEGPVEVVLQVRGQPGHRVPTASFEQVYTHPLGRHIESEAFTYVEVHGFHFGQVFVDAPRQALESERFTG